MCASTNRLGDPQNMDSNLTVHDRLDTPDRNHDSIIEATQMQEPDEAVDVGTMVETTSELRTSKMLNLTALRSVLPKSMIEEGPSSPSVDLASTRESATPNYRQILFSLANNCAGLEDADMMKVISFLQKTASQELMQLLRSDPRYSTRAIAQTVFKGAIELGDANLIDLLLNENSLGIDVNRLWCRIRGHRYTPIQRASWLRHKEVIKVLLEHNSDVNRAYHSPQWFQGALDCAIRTSMVVTGYTRVDAQIFRMLLNAGGDVSQDTLDSLIKFRDSEYVGILMSANALKNVAKWGEWGTFCDAIIFLDDQTAMATIHVMLDIGADLNFRNGRWRQGSFHADTVIDAAAQRGNAEMVELLLKSGARLTRDTLTFAVSSGNHHLMRMLLERRADGNSDDTHCKRFGKITTPLAEAIRLQNPETIGLLQQYNTFRLDDDAQFLAAILAASEVGNITFIERLIQLGGQARAKEMGCALAIAIREGQDEAVTMLIDAGADLNATISEIGPPLMEAIDRHNAGLVHLLLEAGALADYCQKSGGETLRCAVQWGDHSIVKSLILAGAEVNIIGDYEDTPLTAAVERQDKELAQLLLDAGADVNDGARRLNVLELALQKGDISMACYLLDWGADSRNALGLGKAMVESPEFLQLLLEKHRMRSPVFPAKFGCAALTEVIELGDKSAIRMMLDRGLDANSLISTDNDVCCSPFGRAVINCTVDVIELFLQKGCNPNSIVLEASHYQDSGYRLTGFLVAISTRNVSTVKLLHRYGADVNFPAHTRVKRTPLQQAAATGSTDVVELLIRLGAEVNAPAARRDGGTALQFAAIGGYIPIACLLLDLEADVNAPASRVNGRMALEGAAEHGRLDMLQLLLNAGAGNGGRDQGQFTRAMDLARDQDFDHIADFLGNYLRQNQQEDEPVMPVERFEDDFGMRYAGGGIEGIDMNQLDGGIEGIDMDQLDRWMVESGF